MKAYDIIKNIGTHIVNVCFLYAKGIESIQIWIKKFDDIFKAKQY